MKEFRDIRYTDNEKYGKLDVYLPDEEQFDVLVFFHGGGLEAGQKERFPFVDFLNKNNTAVVCPDYRMYPDAKFPNFINDAARAVLWTVNNIGKYGKCGRIFVGGSSAGAYISQMLCFNSRYFEKYKVKPGDISGYVFGAGQPTAHFNVLKERGFDPRRVIADETAPIYFVGENVDYPPMLIAVAEHDMENRCEQTALLYSTLRHFGCDMSKITLITVAGSTHCEYEAWTNENGENVFGKMILDFINRS